MKRYLNSEGYPDPTACGALENIESKERAKKLVRKIKLLCEAEGFELVDRVRIYDSRTGRVYK